MKKFLLFVCMLATVSLFGQKVSGVVMDGNEGLIGASVAFEGTTIGTVTDLDGSFMLNGDGSSDALVISYIGYEDMVVDIDPSASMIDLGNLVMSTASLGLDEVVITGTMDIVRDRRTPVAVSTITVDEIQSKSVGNVEFPEVMKNTPSVYVSNQTGFGDAQMFLRGFNQSNTAFLLNGQPINGMEDGKMYWSNWSGMSDVATAVQVQRGLGSSKLAISSVGGTVNIVTKTTEKKQGGFARLLYGNDNYLKGTFSYNSGLINDKFAVSVLVDHWQADNKWAEGTWGSGQNYFLSLGYKPAENHSINFLVTGAPQSHGQRWSQKQSTLEEKPKFNQHWGIYKGEKISERFNYYHKPILNLNWDWDINNTTSLGSVFYASFGRGGGTGPFGNDRKYRVKTEAGQNDFDAIAAGNIERNADGIGSYGSAMGRRASVNNHQWYGNVTSLKTELAPDVKASVGADVRWYQGDHFRQMVNMYGLSKWSDNYKRFKDAQGNSIEHIVDTKYEANPWSALNDFADRSQRVAYDYSENINYQGLFGQLEYAPSDFSVFVQGAVSNQSYQRTGRWAVDNEKSKKVNKLGYNIKGGASYAFDLNNTVFANAGYYSRQPFLDNVFENVRYSNDFVNFRDNSQEIINENILGMELGYKYFSDNVAAHLNLYNTIWDNRTIVYTFDNKSDPENVFEQRNVQRGIKQVHSGIELDVQYKWDDLTAKLFGSIGDWKFVEMGSFDVFNEDTGDRIKSETNVDLSKVHVPNAPQTSFGLGLNYNAGEGFTASLDMNYFDRIYRRDNFNESDDVLREDIGTLDPYFLVDAGLGYNFNFGGNRLHLRGNVYNLLNTAYFNQTDPYGILNGNGLTWNVSAKYSF